MSDALRLIGGVLRLLWCSIGVSVRIGFDSPLRSAGGVIRARLHLDSIGFGQVSIFRVLWEVSIVGYLCGGRKHGSN